MKFFANTLLYLLLVVSVAVAQPPEFFTRSWKMEKMITTHAGNTITLFHKDSAANLINVSTFKYLFYSNGTYSLLSDTMSGQGTWAFNTTGDSARLDTVSYKLMELSATHFTTRGFSLQLADTLGTIDTAYTYVVLYPSAPLPVNLIYFTGRYTGKEVLLNWSTAQEQQSKEFQVQYSSNGTGFETIGTVNAKGNSTTPTAYAFRTGRYQSGKNFYRLKQVDLDGRTTISPVAIISLDALGQSAISLSPNPASNQLNLYINQPGAGKLQLVLTTLAGRQVWHTALAANTTHFTLYLPPLAKGVYLAYITNSKGEQLFYDKLVIQ